MNAIRAFELEPLSPEDRAYRQAERRRGKREAAARLRAKARIASVTQITFFMEQDHILMLDTLKELRGFRNRSQALALLMTTLTSNPKTKKELGL